MKADRQPVYDALDKLPDMVFCAYLCALSGINKAMALTVLDDPTPAADLEAAMKPHIEKLG